MTLDPFEERRGCAEEFDLAAPVDVGPLTFSLAPHGWSKYRYCLEHPIGRVGATSSTFIPALRVQPRSEFIHAVGPAQPWTASRTCCDRCAPSSASG